MATAEKPFIRQDGKDKVTGLGRYTADLSMTGMLHAKFRYADHAHARILRIDTAKARALAGVFAVITHDDVPDVRYGPFVQDRRLFAKTKCPLRGRARRGRGRADARDRPAGLRADRGRVRAAAGGQRRRGRAAARRAAGARGLGGLRRIRRRRPRRQRLLALDDREGRRRRGHGRGRHGRQGALRRRHVARRADRAARDRRPVAGRPGHDLVVDAGAVHRPQRRRDDARAAREPTSASSCRTSAAASAASASSTTRRTSPRWRAPPAARCGSCSRAARSSSPPTTAARGRCIELETGVTQGRHDRRPPRPRLILDNGAYSADAPFFPQLAAMMAVGPYQIPNVFVDASLAYTNTQPSGSVRAPTAPQACWAVEQHMDSVAAPIGIDPVEFRRRNIVKRGDEGPTRQVLRADRRGRDAGAGGRADRLRQGAARRRGDRRRDRLVAVVRHRLGRVREAQRRRLGHDHHRRPGVRHRRRDGAAAAGRRGCWACSRTTSRSSTRTPTPARSTPARPARRRPSTTAGR